MMKYKRIVALFVIFIATCSATGNSPLTRTTAYAQRLSKTNHSYTKKSAQDPVARLNGRLHELLCAFLAHCTKMSSENDLAQAILCLSVIKHRQPKLFLAYKLDTVLHECFKQARSIVIPSKAHFYALQPSLDFWYFSRLHTSAQQPNLSKKMLRKYLNRASLEAKKSPFNAFTLWLALKGIAYCAPNLYQTFKKQYELLGPLIKQDKHLHGYQLCLELMYETEFGKKTLPDHYTGPSEIINYYGTLDTKRAPLNLLAHLMLGFKLCNHMQHTNAKHCAALLVNAQPHTFQETCFLLCAAT